MKRTTSTQKSRKEAAIARQKELQEKVPDLATQENIIQQAKAAMKTSERDVDEHKFEIGNALMIIQEKKLYKYASGYKIPQKTFQDYCATVFHFSRDYAYKLMNAAKVQRELETAGVTSHKNQEYLLRLLSHKHFDNYRVDIWKIATSQNARAYPTTYSLQKAIKRIRPRCKKNENEKSQQKVDEFISLLSTSMNGYDFSQNEVVQIAKLMYKLYSKHKE